MENDHDDLKRREEEKRAAQWDPAQRWRAILQMIGLAEAVTDRNTPAKCLELQRAKLARIVPERPQNT